MGLVEVALIGVCIGLIIILIKNLDEEEVSANEKTRNKKQSHPWQ